MTELTVQQDNQRRIIPLWKATAVFTIWVTVLVSAGVFVGNRYFWSGLDVAHIEREISYYRQLIETEPDKPEHRVALAFNLHRLKQYESALAQLQAAIEIDNQFFDAYLNRGYIYTELEYWDEALAAFEKCVEISPEDYKGQFNLGIVYRELDMIEAAYESLDKALELRPGATDVIYHQALTALRDDKRETAILYLERALAFDPQYKEALDLYTELNR